MDDRPLHELFLERAATLIDMTRGEIDPQGPHDAERVDARMEVEAAILDRHDGVSQIGRYLIERVIGGVVLCEPRLDKRRNRPRLGAQGRSVHLENVCPHQERHGGDHGKEHEQPANSSRTPPPRPNGGRVNAPVLTVHGRSLGHGSC